MTVHRDALRIDREYRAQEGPNRLRSIARRGGGLLHTGQRHRSRALGRGEIGARLIAIGDASTQHVRQIDVDPPDIALQRRALVLDDPGVEPSRIPPAVVGTFRNDTQSSHVPCVRAIMSPLLRSAH
jgi:hypothetical protein